MIDLTTTGLTQERSRLPVNPWTGSVDLLVNPDGTPWVDLPYGVPTSLGMGAAFYHFWIADRDQVVDMPNPAAANRLPVAMPAGRQPPDCDARQERATVRARAGDIVVRPDQPRCAVSADPTRSRAMRAAQDRGLRQFKIGSPLHYKSMVSILVCGLIPAPHNLYIRGCVNAHRHGHL